VQTVGGGCARRTGFRSVSRRSPMPFEVENPCVPPAAPRHRVPGSFPGMGLAKVAINRFFRRTSGPARSASPCCLACVFRRPQPRIDHGSGAGTSALPFDPFPSRFASGMESLEHRPRLPSRHYVHRRRENHPEGRRGAEPRRCGRGCRHACPDVELVPLRAVLDGSIYRGHEGLRRWLNDMSEDWAGFELTLHGVREVRLGCVLVQATIRLRGRSSGVAVDSPGAWLCDMRGEGRADPVLHRPGGRAGGRRGAVKQSRTASRA
jgi:hypothetical protein